MGIIALALGKLEQMISSNTWPSGGRLPAERELAKTLGVGRTTLREALRILETRGVLEIRSGSGAYLTRPELLERPPTGKEPKILPVQQFEAAYCLVPRLAAWCAFSAGQDTIDRLEQCVSGLGRAFLDHDSKGIAQGYALFIRLMAAETNNPCLRLMVENLFFSGKCPAHDFTALNDPQREQIFAGLVQLWGFIRSHEPALAEKAAGRQQILQALFFCGRPSVEQSVALGPGLREMHREKDIALALVSASAAAP